MCFVNKTENQILIRKTENEKRYGKLFHFQSVRGFQRNERIVRIHIGGVQSTNRYSQRSCQVHESY